MTCGVYGLADPDTGLVRYVGASRQIEAAYKNQCAKPWKWLKRGKLLDWFSVLHRAGKSPVLQILQECNESDFNRVKREQAEILKLVGGADLNVHFSANTLKNARSRRE
jgi:hypothetical protein